jgi:hypothetical protein
MIETILTSYLILNISSLYPKLLKISDRKMAHRFVSISASSYVNAKIEEAHNTVAESYGIQVQTEIKTKLLGFGPRASYTDLATAACWRSSANFCG